MSNQKLLYSDHHKEIMGVFDSLPDMSTNRLELIRDLALGLNYKRIGLANCVMFNREAKVIAAFLSKEFEVYQVHCKHGRLTRDELLEGGGSSVICNPAGQADYLNNHETELNLSIGLCVGHDMVFNSLSQAPVTTIFTKDFTNNNDPSVAVEAIRSI